MHEKKGNGQVKQWCQWAPRASWNEIKGFLSWPYMLRLPNRGEKTARIAQGAYMHFPATYAYFHPLKMPRKAPIQSRQLLLICEDFSDEKGIQRNPGITSTIPPTLKFIGETIWKKIHKILSTLPQDPPKNTWHDTKWRSILPARVGGLFLFCERSMYFVLSFGCTRAKW